MKKSFDMKAKELLRVERTLKVARKEILLILRIQVRMDFMIKPVKEARE